MPTTCRKGDDGNTNRPLTFLELDNLGRAVTTSIYDGDGITPVGSAAGGWEIASGNGSALRARSTAQYDQRGRVFATTQIGVAQENDPANAAGTLTGQSLVTKVFYDGRSNAIKTTAPGGLVATSEYDGAGRVFLTTAGSAAKVLSKTEMDYNVASGATLVTTSDRKPDDSWRVSYAASYVDEAGRTTDAINFGTGTAAPVGWTVAVDAAAGHTDALHMHVDYGTDGWVLDSIDAKRTITRTEHDALGRVKRRIEAYTSADNGAPALDHNRTTSYGYGIRSTNRIFTPPA